MCKNCTEFLYKKTTESRNTQRSLNRQIAKLHTAYEEYYLTSEYVLKPLANAKGLFESSESDEKGLLLKISLQNLKLEGKKVRYE